MLEESARISRGSIRSLTDLEVKNFDALFIPGGFGIAKNFSDFASKGTSMNVDSDVSRVILSFYNAKKPIGATCIAPIVLAKIFGTTAANPGIDLTLGKKGEDWPYADSIEAASKLGNKVISCDVDEVCKDRFSKIVTTPAYMKGTAKPFEVFDGIERLVNEVIKLTKE
jgi:enhancing lycopene biosynthesis protein 2